MNLGLSSWRERENESRIVNRWEKGIQFVNWAGELVDSLPNGDSEASQLFLDCALKEARRMSLKIKREADKLILKHKVNRKDVRNINRVIDGEKIKLPSRAQRVLNGLQDLTMDSERAKSFYRYFGPHGFCFHNYNPNFRNELVDLMNPLLDIRNYRDSSNGWDGGPMIQLYDGEDHSVNIKGYVKRRARRFKIKLHSKHGGIHPKKDKLDVETQFKNGRYDGITHYHVEKPSSMMTLFGLSVDEVTSYGDRYQISFSSEGDETFIYGLGSNDKKISNKSSEEKDLLALTEMQKNPVMAGGSLLKGIIKVVETDSRFQTCLRHSFWYD